MADIPEDKIEERALLVRRKIGLGQVLAPDICCALDKIAASTRLKYRTALESEMGFSEVVFY